MRQITLAHETDFAGWRDAARVLIRDNADPADIVWSIAGSANDLFASATTEPTSNAGDSNASFRVPAEFVELAADIILHRDEMRFSHLYRLLWRLRANRSLLDISVDPDVILARTMAKAVSRDQHKMKAFVRFREIGREPNSRYVAWFEPAHYIVESTASFFTRRFADMAWSILTPDRCVHWDGHKLMFTPGVDSSQAPSSDRLESTWLTYYANIFNPARLKLKAMQKEMPKKYWRNLPEAPLIKSLTQHSSRSTDEMIENGPTDPRPSQHRRIEMPTRRSRAAPTTEEDGLRDLSGTTIKELREAATECRACPLWKDATQTVFGEGPDHASAMFVGEQPGDKEDLAGRPFVGPAGQLFNRALEEAGIDRETVYVTNAVKHFKFVPRGKIRLHQKPNTSEIKACRPWYQRELAVLKPRLLVALGATAAQGVFGRAMPVNANRGKLVEIDDRTQAMITVHPSYLLRLPDENSKAVEYRRFVDDLKIARNFLHSRRAA